ncbi:mitochondrial fission process protein 1 [Tribolium madens]|uniref:mitochondrial fission process protein 1 n=1 Tax=Tribolium madens TaxID=41895 RepID=UPI001CF73349|nr:mitochondrial fission process protein 1 [Tribolium madens]
MSSQDHPRDIYKDTPIRLLGYANEVGESLRGFIGTKWVNISYGVATLYVVADTIDKTGKTYVNNSGKAGCVKKTVFAATDTLIWQMLASVVIPGYTINRVCALSDFVLTKTAKLPTNSRKMIVTGVGLAVIPFIIKPIDNLVHLMLDSSLRKIAP